MSLIISSLLPLSSAKGRGERHPVHRDARQPRQGVPGLALRAAPQATAAGATLGLGGARLRRHAEDKEAGLVPGGSYGLTRFHAKMEVIQKRF